MSYHTTGLCEYDVRRPQGDVNDMRVNHGLDVRGLQGDLKLREF